METKLVKNNKLALLPAGIIEGVEAFWHDNEKWVAFDGHAMRYHEAPGRIQRTIADAFVNDKKSQSYMKKHGVERFSEGFEWWYKCVVGAWDHLPDFINGKFNADAYNSSCNDYTCEHRGRFCSQKVGLNCREVATINALKLGLNFEKTAILLNISMAGFKSRVEKMKEKLDAPNVTSLMAIAAELGI